MEDKWIIIHLVNLVISKALKLSTRVMIIFKQWVLSGTSGSWIECTKKIYKNKCDKINFLGSFSVFASVSSRALFRRLIFLSINKINGICIKLYYFQFGRPTSILSYVLKFSFTCLSEMDIVRIALSILRLFYVGLWYICIQLYIIFFIATLNWKTTRKRK